jgi:hypothetical protein
MRDGANGDPPGCAVPADSSELMSVDQALGAPLTWSSSNSCRSLILYTSMIVPRQVLNHNCLLFFSSFLTSLTPIFNHLHSSITVQLPPAVSGPLHKKTSTTSQDVQVGPEAVSTGYSSTCTYCIETDTAVPRLADVAGTKEPIYGPSAIRSVAEQAKDTPYTELKREDMKWHEMHTTSVETFTFYIFGDNGYKCLVQVIYSNVA